MLINQTGLNLLKTFEGLKLKAYQDVAGICTIGYGHTGKDVYPGLEITEEQACNLLSHDLELVEAGVTRLVKMPINANQFSAFVCFSYNVGLGAFQASTLLKLFNENKNCSEEFLKWIKSDGKVIEGLLARRLAERRLFLTI